MAADIHPVAPHNLPGFITAPGEPDVFLIGSAVFLVIAVLTLGSVYFRLHALPEHMAHRNASKLQFEVVAVLALLALFTHTNALWVAALILALVPIPDFHGPLQTMAASLARMAGYRGTDPPDETAGLPPDTHVAAPAQAHSGSSTAGVAASAGHSATAEAAGQQSRQAQEPVTDATGDIRAHSA